MTGSEKWLRLSIPDILYRKFNERAKEAGKRSQEYFVDMLTYYLEMDKELKLKSSIEKPQVIVKTTCPYGVTWYHPINDNGYLFAELLGVKTLSKKEAGKIRKLGFEIITKGEGKPL